MVLSAKQSRREQLMANIPTEEPLENEYKAAERLDLSVKTLRRWRWAGRGPPFYKIGSAVRYSPPELRAFIKASRRRSTSDPGPEAEK